MWIESRVPLVAHNMLVHRPQSCVLLLELVVCLWRLKRGETARQEGPGIDWLVTLLGQALLCLGRERLVIEP